MRKNSIILLLLSFCSICKTVANVSLRNGNFFIAYTDVAELRALKMERTYNSKSPFKGIFGWGWGYDFAQNLVIHPDGSILVNESGGGASNLFLPVSFDNSARVLLIEEIVTLNQGIENRSGTDLINFKNKLLNNDEFFNEEWEKLISKKMIKPFEVAADTKLISRRFGYQLITKTQDGYERKLNDSKIEFYDNSGRLIKTQTPNEITSLKYTEAGKLEEISDNFNNRMKFFLNSKGLLDSIKCSGLNSQAAYYRYNNKEELIYSKDSDGNVYKHTYDDRHNMTQILYTDGTTLQVSYYDREQFENVKSVKDRDGITTKYFYKTVKDKNNSEIYTVNVITLTSEGKEASNDNYDYKFKKTSVGSEYTAEMQSNIDGVITHTIYDENGTPTTIIRNGDTTTFKYNSKGNIILKETNSDIKELTYSSQCNKINYVKTTDKSANDIQWSKFEYDTKCNLTYGENSGGERIKLIYDSENRIEQINDLQNSKNIFFKYGTNNKPIEITIPTVGSIQVTYTQNGEVKKVDSKGGRSIAVKVTSTFQNLLEIIRPAGVTLSF